MGVGKFYGLNDIHAIHHSRKHRITRLTRLRIQVWVVAYIDKELGVGGVRVTQTRHCYGVAFVAQTIKRFVVHLTIAGLVVQFCVVATRLNHKVWNDAVENQPDIETFFY